MRFRCIQCKPRFEFEADAGICPRCGMVQGRLLFRLAEVHLLVMGSGPIMGTKGKQHLACQPLRDHLARHTRDAFGASPDPRATTCRSCKTTPAWKEVSKLFPDLVLKEALLAQGVRR